MVRYSDAELSRLFIEFKGFIPESLLEYSLRNANMYLGVKETKQQN